MSKFENQPHMRFPWTGPFVINDEVAVIYSEGMISKGVLSAITPEGIELQAVHFQTGKIEADNTIWILRQAVHAISPHDSETCEGCQAKRAQASAGNDLASLLDTAPDPNTDEFGDWVKDMLRGQQ